MTIHKNYVTSPKTATWNNANGIGPSQDVTIFETKGEPATAHAIAFQIGGCEWSTPLDLGLVSRKPRPPKIPIDIRHTSDFGMKFFAEIRFGHYEQSS